jgi:DNA helicase-2/ATP-dependent DNA helicase PcrA
MINYEKDLNRQQLQVVKDEGGYLLVLAGAGSGKTRTLTYRVAYLLERGVAPEKILLATFTNKAARSMLKRVENLAEQYTGKIMGGTFHHIANVILRNYASKLGYRANYSILDSEDSRQLISTCISELKIDVKSNRFPKSNILAEIISLIFNTQSSLEEVLYARYPYYSHLVEEITQIALLYSQKKKELCVMDFDDLLLNFQILLTKNPDVLKNIAGRFHHILVDEYQDVNIIQAHIIDLLAAEHGNLMVVGDDAQSIYSFRGASFESIINFPRRYPDCKIYKLETNYRSTPEIINLANLSIINNENQYPKELTAVRPSGIRPIIVYAQNVLKQADFVAQRVSELYHNGIPLSEIAVLYRAHYHSMELQMELVRREIPFDIRSGIRFFEQAHIKDVTSFMRIIINPHDEIAWRRVLMMYPKIGNQTFLKLWSIMGKTQNPLDEFIDGELINSVAKAANVGIKSCRKHLNQLVEISSDEKIPEKIIDILLDDCGYRQYLQQNYTDAPSREEDLTQLAVFSKQYISMEDFLNELALLTNMASQDGYEEEEKSDKIILSTIHQAKGLEWSYVFLIWCTEGMLPLQRALKEKEGEEEERRLFYVALTRAKDQLYLCCPALDYSRGLGNIALAPSRFISEITPITDKEERPFEQWTLYADY